MPKGFTDREKEWIQNRLLEQGARLFSAYGLKKTSIDEIAAAAGISKGAFYLFYASKEIFFMDVVEQAEKRYRLEILAAVDRPGPSPRARLLAVLKTAFTLWKTIPLFQAFSSSEFEVLARRIPPEVLQEHMASDRVFIEELIARCRRSGIPIQAPLDQVHDLTYTLLFASLHENDFGPGSFAGSIDLMLELVAAFWLGEITLLPGPTVTTTSQPDESRHP